MKTLQDIAKTVGCCDTFVIRCLSRGDVPGCTTQEVRGGRLYRQWNEHDAEATIAALRMYTHRTLLTPEEEIEITEQCKGLRQTGMTWGAINVLLDTPYKHVDSLRLLCLRNGYKDGRVSDPEALEAKREQVSIEWANNPPPGSEYWSDAEWLRRIDQAAFGRRAQEEDSDD